MTNALRACITSAAICCFTHLQAQPLPKNLIKDAHSGKQVPFDKIFQKGEVTLVSFWATWCIPGKREVKTIVKKMPEWKKQADFNYIAVAVDQQHNEELVRPYIQSQKWNFPVYVDANSALKGALGFNGLPFIMIVDKKGNVVFTHTGFDDGTLILAAIKDAEPH